MACFLFCAKSLTESMLTCWQFDTESNFNGICNSVRTLSLKKICLKTSCLKRSVIFSWGQLVIERPLLCVWFSPYLIGLLGYMIVTLLLYLFLTSCTFQWQPVMVSVTSRNITMFHCFIVVVHDDVIKCKHFPRNWSFVSGIHRPQVVPPHKGQWRRA